MAVRKTGKPAAMTAQETQETTKAVKAYKVVCGTFERRIEAIEAAKTAKKKGFPARLIIERGKYRLLFSERISRPEAVEAIKNLAAADIKAEIV